MCSGLAMNTSVNVLIWLFFLKSFSECICVQIYHRVLISIFHYSWNRYKQVTLQNHRTYIPLLLLLVFTIAISRNILCQRGITSNNPDTAGRKWDCVEDKKRARLVWRRYVQCTLPTIAHDCPRPMRNSLIWKIWAWARLSRGLGHCQRLGGRVLLRVISESFRIYLDITFHPGHPNHPVQLVTQVDMVAHFTLITMDTLITLSPWLPNHFYRTICNYCFRVHLCQLREYSKDPINLAGQIHFISHKVAEISSRAQLDLAQMITLGTV